jgi:hypothetical protein
VLKTLKPEQLTDLILASRKCTGKKVALEVRTWPKSKEQQVAYLTFADGKTARRWEASLHGTQQHKHVKLLSCSNSRSCLRPVQKENPVWLAIGNVFPGKHHWVASSTHGAREDVARGRLEVGSAQHLHDSSLVYTEKAILLLLSCGNLYT